MNRSTQPRGYAIVFVLVFGIVLAALSGILLYATSRDRDEGRQQENAVRALYAAEAGVAVGTSLVGEALRINPTPDVTSLTATALAQLVVAAPTASFPEYSIKYLLNKDTGASSTLPPSPTPAPSQLTSGPYRGLMASQLPIQVLASSSVGKARATIADAVQVNLIPVFQFALFMDGPIEYFLPEPSAVSGRIHSNSGFFFGTGADGIEFLRPLLTTAGRVHLRATSETSSQTAGRAPGLDTDNAGGVDTQLPCDNAPASAVSCPGGQTWLSYTTTNLPFIRDQEHGTQRLNLPTGVDAAAFTQKVIGVPDTCGINETTGNTVTTAGTGVPLSPDWQVIDIPRAGDTAALKQVKYAHRAGIRVVDGVWTRRNASGSYDPWFSQADPSSTETQCVYYGYNPSTDAAVANTDGVPAIQDQRSWDFQDRRMRRISVVDIHRLRRCLPFLDSVGFNGVMYFGETLEATEDNWGLNPDDDFYALDGGGNCNTDFINLPHYLRGQISTNYGFATPPVVGGLNQLANDNVAVGTTRLDNPYYPSSSFCAPNGAGRVRGLGDGPLRLPQGNNDGVIDRGRNELVETAVLLRNAQRLPTVFDSRERGFTFATNAPLYLQGDINTLVGAFSATGSGYAPGKVPGSVAGDAVTFLSDKFNLLAGNPFAPVGQLATVNGAAWTHLNSDLTVSGNPASPAPCTNLLRELLLRRPAGRGVPNAAAGFPHVYAPVPVARNWQQDLRAAGAQPLFVDANQNGVVDGAETALAAASPQQMNAFVAYAPLESFVDLDMLATMNPGDAGFTSRTTPTQRNSREAVRDWMRCTLNSRHPLADDGSVASITYAGVQSLDAVQMPPGQPQPGTVTDPALGMRAPNAAFNVTHASILGSDGFAPMDATALFVTGGSVLFSRDRSGLTDPNGSNNPTVIDPALTTLAQAGAGDQLAINLSILTGTTWGCPNAPTYPGYGTGANVSNDSYAVSGITGAWTFSSLDEGVYGIFRLQESWVELSTSGGIGNSNYIDFFVNGSVVAMFYSREANGKHVINQGFYYNMFSGCGGGNDNNQRGTRDCRLNPGFEYAWESARRSITYDPANDAPGGLAPGVPLVVSTDRLRWVRR
jgi:hypothetical protein